MIAKRRRSTTFTDTNVLGFKMRLNPEEWIDSALLRAPEDLDFEEIAFLRSRLQPGDIFVDLGAYIGFYALNAARVVGANGTVIAVEAAPQTFERLCESLEMNQATNVRPLNIGVSDANTAQRLFIRQHPWVGASTLLADSQEGIEVECKPLLDILREQSLAHVTGMKLDIEGMEYRVLSRFFADAHDSLYPRFVIVEFHPNFVGHAGGNVLELLAKNGYRIVGRNQANYMLELDLSSAN
jgi:FkbM family methyltransferase